MSLFDSKEQAAEAQINGGRQMIAMAESGRASALPSKLSTSQKLDLHKKGAKEIIDGTRKLNKLRQNQSTDSNN